MPALLRFPARLFTLGLLLAVAQGCVTSDASTRSSSAAPAKQPVIADAQPYVPASQIKPNAVDIPAAPVVTVPQVQARRSTHVAGSWTPPVAPRAWRYIVIHHSATDGGNAKAFDAGHKANGWDELGYHFVIGNGSGSGDGQIEVGPRWLKQKYGAHAKTPDERYNNFGIGICLVGNFQNGKPSPKQIEALSRLVAWLMETYDIPASQVLGHRDTKQTACPGKFTDVAAIRARATRLIADAGGTVPHEPVAVRGELIR